jgi:diacylglycerol kinase (ATP)
MVAKLILNPYAGRWSALQRAKEVEDALKNAGIDFEVVHTERPRHGVELARQAVLDGYTLIIAAGGDGSISEVVNGMMKAVSPDKFDTLPPLGIMPLGSANDLIANLGMTIDLRQAAEKIANKNSSAIDLGSITYVDLGSNSTAPITCYFDNNSAIGLEPTVTLVQQKIGWLRGTIRYLLAAVIAVMKKQHWVVRMKWDNGSYEGPVSLITVGNGPQTGGFFMTPHARIDDGKLTFVYGFVPSRREIFALLPKALKPGVGNFTEDPAISEVDTTKLTIQCQPSTPLHADGEIQTKITQSIEYSILPHALRILGR